MNPVIARHHNTNIGYTDNSHLIRLKCRFVMCEHVEVLAASHGQPLLQVPL